MKAQGKFEHDLGKEENSFYSEEHKELLSKRLERIETGKVIFKSWDSIKKLYSIRQKSAKSASKNKN